MTIRTITIAKPTIDVMTYLFVKNVINFGSAVSGFIVVLKTSQYSPEYPTSQSQTTPNFPTQARDKK